MSHCRASMLRWPQRRATFHGKLTKSRRQFSESWADLARQVYKLLSFIAERQRSRSPTKGRRRDTFPLKYGTRNRLFPVASITHLPVCAIGIAAGREQCFKARTSCYCLTESEARATSCPAVGEEPSISTTVHKNFHAKIFSNLIFWPALFQKNFIVQNFKYIYY